MSKFRGISSTAWWIFVLMFVVVIGIIITGVVIFFKADKDVEPDYCGDKKKCKPINLTLDETNEKISLPTHCLNILNKSRATPTAVPRCAWFWPEGLDELFNIDEFINPNETTKNLRDWAKNRKDAFSPHLDLNKFPQHHQTIEIVTEGNCPAPFMDFIVLGETTEEQNEKFGVCTVLPENMVNVLNHLGVFAALA